MQWDDTPGAGFTAGDPWIAINPNHVAINAASQVNDPASVFAHYQRLIALRHESAIVREGRTDLIEPVPPRPWAFTRTLGGQQWLVVANMSSVPLALPDAVHRPDAEVVLGTHPKATSGVLQPWESRVLDVSQGLSRRSVRSGALRRG